MSGKTAEVLAMLANLDPEEYPDAGLIYEAVTEGSVLVRAAAALLHDNVGPLTSQGGAHLAVATLAAGLLRSVTETRLAQASFSPEFDPGEEPEENEEDAGCGCGGQECSGACGEPPAKPEGGK